MKLDKETSMKTFDKFPELFKLFADRVLSDEERSVLPGFGPQDRREQWEGAVDEWLEGRGK